MSMYKDENLERNITLCKSLEERRREEKRREEKRREEKRREEKRREKRRNSELCEEIIHELSSLQ